VTPVVWIEGVTWGVGVADTTSPPADRGSVGVVSGTDSNETSVVGGGAAGVEEVAGDAGNEEVSETSQYQENMTFMPTHKHTELATTGGISEKKH